jgi:hypothetical protein
VCSDESAKAKGFVAKQFKFRDFMMGEFCRFIVQKAMWVNLNSPSIRGTTTPIKLSLPRWFFVQQRIGFSSKIILQMCCSIASGFNLN